MFTLSNFDAMTGVANEPDDLKAAADVVTNSS